MSLPVLLDVISDAAKLGYRGLSVSGGEPIMYRGLGMLLAHAKSLGMVTSVTSNGYFATPKMLERLSDYLDVLAISMDGPPSIHNQMRGRSDAFERLEKSIDVVQAMGIKFGLVHTLTPATWEHLFWIGTFAADNQASLLQIHPLELAGRAAVEMGDASVEFDVAGRAYVIAMALAGKYADFMAIQIDLMHRDFARNNPSLVYATSSEQPPKSEAGAPPIDIIVLQADGNLVPISYGLNTQFKICNVGDTRLVDAWPSYLRGGYQDFLNLCREEFAEICSDTICPVFNWTERIVSRSNRFRRGNGTGAGFPG